MANAKAEMSMIERRLDNIEAQLTLLITAIKKKKISGLDVGLAELKMGKYHTYGSVAELDKVIRKRHWQGVSISYKIRPVDSVETELSKLLKRDRALYLQILKKLDKIAEDPHNSGKWMHGTYAGVKEVHLMHGRFVLMFKIDDKDRIVSVVNFEHHPESHDY
jgi:mRNA-degrading endonuclease RelE of RelBE toxin-antitoxin system